MKIHVHEHDYGLEYEVYLYSENEKTGDVQVVRALEMETIAANSATLWPKTPLVVSKKDRDNPLQGLMNDLWALGFRPAEQVSSKGEIDATKYHLEDMRRLVFGSEKKKEVEQKHD